MDYLQKLKYHYRPKKGWVNDPNGLIYFGGYYHVFYQHVPHSEIPGDPVCWGHARTKDFLSWEELPVALTPGEEYDKDGCWSGTAAVKDGMLYLIYASIRGEEKIQTVSVAYSKDGMNFEKYPHNPVIDRYPPEGSPSFRDPAVCRVGDDYYCVMASGNPEAGAARLLLYKSADMFSWEYLGVMCEWKGSAFAECPSFLKISEKNYLLAASVVTKGKPPFFAVMFGSFEGGKFTIEYSASPDRGPDQYAGQVFRDDKGRCILISWIPGWNYIGLAARDVGCMSVPKELTLEDGKIRAYPVAECRRLLRDEDPAVKRTENGFIIPREGRDPVVYEGEIRDLKILRDGYIVEVFVNGGEAVFTALL